MPVGGGRPRIAGLTRQQLVWKWLHDHGPHDGIAVSKALRMTMKARVHHLRALEARGFVRGIGKTRKTWEAVGTVLPPDLRGLMPGTVASRKRKQVGTINYTGDRKKVSNRDFPKVAKPKLAIEEAWGWGV